MKVVFYTAHNTRNLAMVIMSLIYRTCKKHYNLKEINFSGTIVSSLKASSQNVETYSTIPEQSLCTHNPSPNTLRII